MMAATGKPNGASAGWSRTMAKNFLRLLMSYPNPIEGLREIKTKLPELGKAIIPRKEASGKGWDDLLLGGTITFGSSALFWTGLTAASGLILPAVAGTVGLVKLFQGVGKFSSAAKRFEFIKTYYTCLRVMERADNFSSEQEKKFLEALLTPLAVSEKERLELEELPVPKPENISIPGWLERDQKLTILQGCWGLLYCDAVTKEEEGAFSGLVARLGLTDVDLEKIRCDAQAAMDEQQKTVLRIGALADYLEGGMVNRGIKDIIYALAVKAGTESQLAMSIQQLKEADRLGKEEILALPLGWQAAGTAYFLCTIPGISEDGPEQRENRDKRFQTLCKEMKLEKDGEELRSMAADLQQTVLDARKELEGA